ncbi:MAG: putative lipid II flippase FtsW [Anaerofustis stercorihominis]|nr:putative lipid II flippase FtsW [Anaerofustis stercorihominis]
MRRYRPKMGVKRFFRNEIKELHDFFKETRSYIVNFSLGSTFRNVGTHIEKSCSDMWHTIPLMIRGMKAEAKKRSDLTIVMLILILLCTGFVMIWSASMYEARLAGNEFSIVTSQIKYAAVGLVLMYLVSLIDYRHTRKYAGFAVLLMFVMLCLIFVDGFSGEVKGATRGLSIGPVTFMPVEPTKIAVLLFMSHIMDKRISEVHKTKTFLKTLIFCGVLCLIIVLQPALSSGIIVAGLIIGIFFMAGGRLSYIVALGGLGCGAVAYYVLSSPWRVQRLFAFLDPFADLLGSGWQPAQSLMALGSGGLFGQGIGNGVAKLSYIPESQNDYIFSIIGEELGLFGCLFVIFGFLFLVFRLLILGLRAPDMYGRLICSGMGILIAIQVFLNIAVVTNSMPSTGITLPFISSGGSSLVTLLFGMGIVLNVSRNIRRKNN